MWRQQAGRVLAVPHQYEKRLRSLGIPANWMDLAPAGASDLVGLAHGFHVECEVKSLSGRESQDQQNWGRMIDACKGIRLVSRSGAEFVDGLNAALALRGLTP